MNNICIINTQCVPSGNASVNRLLSYSTGLVKLGNHVTVISSAYSKSAAGEYRGVKYYNVSKGECFFYLVWSILSIINHLKNDKFDVVIIVSNSLCLIYPIVLACRIMGIPVVQEKSEFPFVLMKKGLFGRLWATFYTSTTYKLFDGLIVMTKPLMDYFKPRVRKDCKIIEVPMTVDLHRFDIEKKHCSEYGKYIAYCGDMTGNKDGVENLIKAFSIASEKINDIKLLLIGGSSNDDDFNGLKAFAVEECPDKIIFYGRAPREAIPQLLKDACALALARPSSLQSTGGFPTKLGEYLATGNPVVVTAVGDIPLYLNPKNSFIVQPDDVQAFANQIIAVFEDYDSAQKIGLEGRKVAQSTFNSLVQAPRIHKFLEQLCV